MPEVDTAAGLNDDELAILQAGLVALSVAKPENPLEWLGQWLKENNPKRGANPAN
eukprot:COSAG05_NODE_584_length_8527_cov_46.366279_11_plen_55_part_00